MSSLTIRINTDNAAFDDENWNAEVLDILTGLANTICKNTEGVIKDSNGNRVGTWKAT